MHLDETGKHQLRINPRPSGFESKVYPGSTAELFFLLQIFYVCQQF
jgi:hypothetical protein